MAKFRNPNGFGSVVKLCGKRRRPYACRKTIGFYENGHPKYKYISYHRTRREAENALREYNADPYNLNQKTFAEVYQLWYDYQGYSGKVGNKYENAFKRCAPLHNNYMSELTLPKIQGLFDSLVLSKAILGHVKMLLNGMIQYSAKRGLMPISSMEIMKLVDAVPRKETRKEKRAVFTRPEIEELWKHKDEDLPRIMLFYIYTGLRFSEFGNAEWHEDYIDIKKAKTKAGVRMVPLSDKAKSLLPLPELPPYTKYQQAMVNEWDHNPHDTRHTFVSLLTEAGVDSRLIKKLVGHATNDVTENVYTHVSLETLLEAVNKI